MIVKIDKNYYYYYRTATRKQGGMSAQHGLDELPSEVIAHIVRFLDNHRDVCALAQVNKRLRAMTSDERSVWRPLMLRHMHAWTRLDSSAHIRHFFATQRASTACRYSACHSTRAAYLSSCAAANRSTSSTSANMTHDLRNNRLLSSLLTASTDLSQVAHAKRFSSGRIDISGELSLAARFRQSAPSVALVSHMALMGQAAPAFCSHRFDCCVFVLDASKLACMTVAQVARLASRLAQHVKNMQDKAPLLVLAVAGPTRETLEREAQIERELDRMFGLEMSVECALAAASRCHDLSCANVVDLLRLDELKCEWSVRQCPYESHVCQVASGLDWMIDQIVNNLKARQQKIESCINSLLRSLELN